MIEQESIQHWTEEQPWQTSAMVEQDLVICRALVDIFSDEFLASQLAFRGGTALHKLYLHPQPRYSEDIDLVQIHPGPIKDIMFRLGEVLNWLPNRSTAQKKHSNKLYFKFESEVAPVVQLRLKVEINCMEHFHVLELQKVPFRIENTWYKGEAMLTTYAFEELLGTKLRALYQRKKGRDLFDLEMAIRKGGFDVDKVMACYKEYIEFVAESAPTYKQVVQNMALKIQDEEFLQDVYPLLRPEQDYDPQIAYQHVYDTFIDRMPGRRPLPTSPA